MSHNGTCNHCDRPIPNGEAVIRSIDFERVFFHRPCAEQLGLVSRRVAA